MEDDLGNDLDTAMVAVAEYGTRFAADVAAAHLTEYDIASAIFGDPAHSVAPHHVTHPGFTLMVLSAEADDAVAVLGLNSETPTAEALDSRLYHRHFQERPRWIRYLTYALLLSLPIPLTAALLIVLWRIGTAIFP